MASDPVSKFYLESVDVLGEVKERVMFVRPVGTCSSINLATDSDKKEYNVEWKDFVAANPSFADKFSEDSIPPKAEDETETV